ncbi:ATP-grasp domain-containing protein [Alkalihalobacterium sp. APHAB7]|uniref:ATP-grasp domain-containing protein n=1 Tax=Alkalihalobacterium sp. APHAB7 TaxID=3402081 RepID=UPI003AB06036
MKKKRTGWLIYNREDADKNQAYIKWMLEEAELLNIDLSFYFKEELLYGVLNQQLFIHHHQAQLQLPDFAIMRNIDPLFSQQLEALGVTVFNNSFVSGLCNDKARTHQFLTRAGIPMLNTLFVKKNEFVPLHLPFSYPIVVKEVSGRSGQQVYAVENLQALESLLANITSNDLIIQEMGDVPGKDVRVFVIGSTIIAAILRYSTTDFKANFSLGGSAKLYELNDEETTLVEKIIAQFDGQLGLVGIDFLFNKEGQFIFNEIEDVVGSRTLSANSSYNIVRLYLQHIMQVLGGV